MGPIESRNIPHDVELYTRIKKRLHKTAPKAAYTEKAYYNNQTNNFIGKLPAYERDKAGNLIMTDNEKVLARALYDENGSKATLRDIKLTLQFLKNRLNDPLKGYHKTMASLINSSDSGLNQRFKGTYDSVNNAHKDLVNQLSMYYHRGNK